MKITKHEILLLQDVVGNASLALRYLHSKILPDIDDEIISEISEIGRNLTLTADSVIKTRRPLSARKIHDTK